MISPTVISSDDLAGPEQLRRGEFRFHLQMGFAFALVFLVTAVGCRVKGVRVVDLSEIGVALFVALAAVAPLPLYWQEKGRTDFRDAALTIPWAMLFAVLLPFTVDVAARMNMPLWDETLTRTDLSLGVSVPGIVYWASHSWLGTLANKSYPLLVPMLPIAILAPALTGKVVHAQDFLISNLVAFTIGLTLFALMPAIGPWYGFHFPARPAQLLCESQFLAMRQPGPYSFEPAGIVCFPSFHVIWAILCARSLWCFPAIRIPVALLSGLIILSTLTTGWHYFTDVIVGIVLALISIGIAKASRSPRSHFSKGASS